MNGWSAFTKKIDLFKGTTTKAKEDKKHAEWLEEEKKTWSKQQLIDHEKIKRHNERNPSQRKIAKGKGTGKLNKAPLTGEKLTSKRSYYNPTTKKVHRSNWLGWKTDH